MKCYLAGPMDLCPDRGRSWREDIATRLRADGWHVFSPTENPLECGPARERRAAIKATGDWDAFSAEMREIRQVDLAQVAMSDLVICHLGPPACGTFFEIEHAKRLCKPVYIHAEHVNDWLYAELPWQRFYRDWDALLEAVSGVRAAA